MKAIALSVVVLVSLSAVSAAAVPTAPIPTVMVAPTLLGPHPHPDPGSVLEEFPAKVHAWHSIQAKEEARIDLHRASHIVVKGPDGLWVDGIVHVGNHVSFLADHPDRLAIGTYKVSTVARWADGGADDSFSWEFSVEKKGD